MTASILLQVLFQGLMVGLFYSLFSSGLTVFFSVTRLFNFAHGDFMVLAMYGCLLLYVYLGIDPYLALIITIPFLGSLGIFVYNFLIKRVLYVHFAMVLQLTLGVAILLENIFLMLFKAEPVSMPTFISLKIVRLGPLSIKMPLIVSGTVAVIVLSALYWILRKTNFGLQVRAISQNILAARIMGIDIEKTRMTVFVIGLVLLALSGSCAVPLFALNPFLGLHLTLFAFIVVTLGGLGNFLGTILGGITLGIAEATGSFFMGGDEAFILAYGIFLVILLFKPEGLLGERVEVMLR